MHLRPRLAALLLLIGGSVLLFPVAGRAQCIRFEEAQKYIGATRCVSGKVLHVKLGNGGVHFFDFCEDFRLCPFTVVVFPGDLKQVGDVRGLEGRQIEIEGEVKGYDGRAEIILKRSGQLHGDAGRLPPVPKEYDVERRGRHSAGTLRFPKKAKTGSTKSKPPGTVTWDDPSAMEPEYDRCSGCLAWIMSEARSTWGQAPSLVRRSAAPQAFALKGQ